MNTDNLPCSGRATGDGIPLYAVCPVVKSLQKIKTYLLSEGIITCISCLHGPFTKEKGSLYCSDCKDFLKWEPEAGGGNNCNNCDNVEADELGPVCGECNVLNPEKSVSKWQSTS